MMIFDYISQYETHKTLDTAIALCQFLLDTDQTTTHEGRKYKTLCTYPVSYTHLTLPTILRV